MRLLVNKIRKRTATAALEFVFCLPAFFIAVFFLINLAFISYNLYALRISAMNSANAISNVMGNLIMSGQSMSNACQSPATIQSVFSQNSLLSHSVFYGTISYNASYGGSASVCGGNNGYSGSTSNVTVTETIQFPLVFGGNLFSNLAPLTASYTASIPGG